MTYLRVDIVGFADESFPGFVHCDFIDANGNGHTFLEKIPVVTTQNLWRDSTYPQPGMMQCETVECFRDAEGRSLARVCINSMDPTHPAHFVVLESQLENAR